VSSIFGFSNTPSQEGGSIADSRETLDLSRPSWTSRDLSRRVARFPCTTRRTLTSRRTARFQALGGFRDILYQIRFESGGT
jgi:hypothetical protein